MCKCHMKKFSPCFLNFLDLFLVFNANMDFLACNKVLTIVFVIIFSNSH